MSLPNHKLPTINPITAVARPRYTRNPNTSVSVVTATAEDSAGSILSALKPSGTTTPLIPATTRFAVIAIPTTSARYSLPFQMNRNQSDHQPKRKSMHQP